MCGCLPEHLQKVENGRSGYHYGGYKRCTNCGYETTEDFVFCPEMRYAVVTGIVLRDYSGNYVLAWNEYSVMRMKFLNV